MPKRPASWRLSSLAFLLLVLGAGMVVTFGPGDRGASVLAGPVPTDTPPLPSCDAPWDFDAQNCFTAESLWHRETNASIAGMSGATLAFNNGCVQTFTTPNMTGCTFDKGTVAGNAYSPAFSAPGGATLSFKTARVTENACGIYDQTFVLYSLDGGASLQPLDLSAAAITPGSQYIGEDPGEICGNSATAQTVTAELPAGTTNVGFRFTSNDPVLNHFPGQFIDDVDVELCPGGGCPTPTPKASAANDTFAGATVIAALPFTDHVDTSSAISDGNDPVSSCSSPYTNSVWYRYTPPANETIVVTTRGSQYPTLLAAFTGSKGSLTELVCSETFGSFFSTFKLSLTGGVTYHFLVGATGGSPGGKLKFSFLQADNDGDGITDDVDNCPYSFNPGQEDADNDGVGNVCDFDGDNDGFDDYLEIYFGSDPLNPASVPENNSVNPGSCADALDNDLDGLIDAADPNCDTDGDGAPDKVDNCPFTPNPGQENFDGDTEGDACDVDDDNDGFYDFLEELYGSDPLNPASVPENNFGNPGSCADTIDNDLDGLTDGADPGCDYDGDGVSDKTDNCVFVPNPGQENFDGDTQGDACDLDDDNDGFSDQTETNAGSDPLNAASTPEHPSINPGSCTDGLDNDLDGLTDGDDPPCPRPPDSGLAFALGIDKDADGIDECTTRPGGPAACSLPLSGAFTLKVYLDGLPTGISDYLGFDIVADFAGVSAKFISEAQSWPDCAFQAFGPPTPPLAWGCVVGIPPVPSTYTGLIGTSQFHCTGDGNIRLLHGTGSTVLVNGTGPNDYYFEAGPDRLDIDCKPVPPTDTPTPTPTPPPVPRVLKQPALQNVFLTRQGAKTQPGRCDEGTNIGLLTEKIGVPVASLSPKGERQSLAAFEFEVRFDAKDVCVNLVPGPAWTGNPNVVCTVRDKDSSTLEGIAQIGCVTIGKDVKPDTLVLATIEVRPQPELYSQMRPNQDNGIAAQVLNQDCQLADEQGHAIPIFSCEDADITFRFLEGDVDGPDCKVDVFDAQNIAFRWGVSKGSLLFNSFMDLEPSGQVKGDGDIDISDLQFVFGRFGSTCDAPWPAQLPVNPKS